MPTIVQRGSAMVAGMAGTFGALGYEQQTGDVTHSWTEAKVQDRYGNDCAKRATNVMKSGAFKFKLLGSSSSVAKASAQMQLPYAKITFEGFDCEDWNGDWHVVSGEKTSLANVSIGDKDLSLERYDDETQNALMNTTPA